MKKWFGIFIAVVCLVGLGVPAMATDTPATQSNWAVDGEIGIFTDYTWTDEDAGDTKNFKVAPWDDLKFGSKYRGEHFQGDFSIKLDDNAGVGNYTALVDKAVGTAKLSAFSVKFGLDDALSFNPVGSFRGKYGNSGIGSQIGGTKKYQVGVIVPVAKGMNIAALIAQPGQYWADLSGNTMETTLPAFEVAFSAFTGFPWKVFAGYESNKDVASDETVTAYLVGAVVRPKIGPVMLNVVASYATNFYQNQGSPWMTRAAFAGPYQWNYDPTQDTTKLGIAFGAEWWMTEKFGLGVGGGYQVFNADDDAAGIKYEDPMISYWVEAAYNVTSFFRILPYFVIEDRSDLKAKSAITGGQFDGKQGVTSYLGILWSFYL